MLPDQVSNPGPLTYESAALPIALRGPQRSVASDQGISSSYRTPYINGFSLCMLTMFCTVEEKSE